MFYDVTCVQYRGFGCTQLSRDSVQLLQSIAFANHDPISRMGARRKAVNMLGWTDPLIGRDPWRNGTKSAPVAVFYTPCKEAVAERQTLNFDETPFDWGSVSLVKRVASER